MATGPTR